MSRQILEFNDLVRYASGSPCVGRVVEITAAGQILVDFSGNQSGPVCARTALAIPLDKPDQPVLLVFENGDINLPIIAGVIRDNNSARSGSAPDTNEVVLKADRELTLVCGKSSITLRRDGRVIIKGAEIVSRSSGTNKIRGASVSIN